MNGNGNNDTKELLGNSKLQKHHITRSLKKPFSWSFLCGVMLFAVGLISLFTGHVVSDPEYYSQRLIKWSLYMEWHKYILPQTEKVKKWVLETIGSAWRLFKCRLKAAHYYKYDNDTERWKHRPSRIPDSHFKLLLQYWNTSTAKKISAQNSENRRLLDNMHTAGPVSFARIYQKLANRDGEPPSKRIMFEETRKRKDGRIYKNSFDDTFEKIEKMKELEVLHETGLSDTDTDPFDRVMGSTQNGRVQLYGRGVSMKNLKEKGFEVKRDFKSVVVPEEYVDAIKSGLHSEMQKDFEAQKEKLTLDMKQELEAQKDKMVEDVVTKALVRLRDMFPDMAIDTLGQAVISSALSD